MQKPPRERGQAGFAHIRKTERGKAGVPFPFLPQVTPLLLACMSKAWDIALLLLSKGADPNKAASDEDGNGI